MPTGGWKRGLYADALQEEEMKRAWMRIESREETRWGGCGAWFHVDRARPGRTSD